MSALSSLIRAIETYFSRSSTFLSRKMSKISFDLLYENIKKLDYDNWNWFICDDFSSDSTLEKLKKISADDERIFIVTWDRYIKSRCEYTELDTDITMSEYDFDKLRDKYIKLNIEEKWIEFENWVDTNEMYCSYYNDNPKMFIDSEMHLNTQEDNDNMKSYMKR
jgi:hypothetical protein